MLYCAGLILTPSYKVNAYGKKNFWNTTEPSEWNEKQTAAIMTRSPWARQASADIDMSSMGPGGGPPPMGGGGQGGPGPGMPPGGPGGMPNFKILVRWESAKPVRLARKEATTEPPSFYIISVSGLPQPPGGPGPDAESPDQDRADEMKAQLMQDTQLQVRGKSPISPEKVEVSRSNGSLRIVSYFPRSPALAMEDKEVSFITKMGPLDIKAKFPLKDMEYKGQLEL